MQMGKKYLTFILIDKSKIITTFNKIIISNYTSELNFRNTITQNKIRTNTINVILTNQTLN